MKILAIGNSFSEDATYYLKKIADSAHVDVTVVNLYIGGCTLQTHGENIKANAAAYRYERNGLYTDKTVSIADTLQQESWDVVTVQQQSGLSGIYESYGENMKTVLDCVKQYAPQAKIYFHQTWAYRPGSDHPDFAFYEYSQETMFRQIEETVSRVCREHGSLSVIPAGEAVRQAIKLPAFDETEGSLYRDGFHLNVVYGRYLLGLVWFAVLTGNSVDSVTFVPTEKDLVNGFVLESFQCEPQKLRQLKDIVKRL